ncbi:hypothetical protein PHYSODRAFT_489287 [Phytophthora sojae]|uniref:Uncharacterized protein n=1 Tax=Phytophthora sojae (strain P6497) TaxID=1094619 RepID=G4Z9I6_PHYSP|nr:hypothetical protein PHYSODRAFT_489287 [Phytophthora sojae]EGZ22618.1 hypothetical protein PHYSODRAFT_489287 [Phytophthora sojae]|eukprot:XP_009525335.1 hypothetical protein PHYSODRAFT_489287 [Phytophthora sojae]
MAEMGRMLLDHGADIEAVDGEDWTPLMCAAWRGHKAMVEMLLERGAYVDRRLPDGATALYLASEYGQLEVARALVKNRANVNAENEEEVTPMAVATMNNHSQVVSLLRRHGGRSKTPAVVVVIGHRR